MNMEEKSFVQRIKETMLDIPARVQRRKYEAEEVNVAPKNISVGFIYQGTTTPPPVCPWEIQV